VFPQLAMFPFVFFHLHIMTGHTANVFPFQFTLLGL